MGCRGPDLDTEDDDNRRGGGGGGDDGGGGGNSVIKKTAQQLAGEAVLSRLVSEVDGASFSFQWVASMPPHPLSHSLHPSREASQVANFIRKTGKKQTTRFAGHLELGSSLKIPCKIFTKVREVTWGVLSW